MIGLTVLVVVWCGVVCPVVFLPPVLHVLHFRLLPRLIRLKKLLLLLLLLLLENWDSGNPVPILLRAAAALNHLFRCSHIIAAETVIICGRSITVATGGRE